MTGATTEPDRLPVIEIDGTRYMVLSSFYDRSESGRLATASQALEMLRQTKPAAFSRISGGARDWRLWLLYTLPQLAAHYDLDADTLLHEWVRRYAEGAGGFDIAAERRRFQDRPMDDGLTAEQLVEGRDGKDPL